MSLAIADDFCGVTNFANFKLDIVKNRNSKRWLAPAAIFFSAFVIWGLVRFLAEPDHRYIVRGIDVSAHTGEINWQIVKGQRVSFVFVKASEGATLSDKNYRKN